MNECPPKEFFSGSLTTDQLPPTAVYRQNWEENWFVSKPGPSLKSTMNGYKSRDYQQSSSIFTKSTLVNEDVGIPPCPPGPRKKKCGISDPRFKRVINSGTTPEMYGEKFVRSANAAAHQVSEGIGTRGGESLEDKVISFLKAPNEPSLFSSADVKKFVEEEEDNYRQDLSEMVTKDVGFEPDGSNRRPNFDIFSQANRNSVRFGEPEKIKINMNSNLKRSLSDCTLHTKNNLADETEEDYLQKIKSYPSATRINKVHNWMKDFKLPAEKRRSVITVIGQTQRKPFSKILSEINQRRKLAKELDKHALCNAIMESAEMKTDVRNLIAKVDFVLPDGKIIYSTEKVYLRKENSKYKIGKKSDESFQRNFELNVDEKLRKRCEMIPERDRSYPSRDSVSETGKRSRTKRSSRKSGVSLHEEICSKDKSNSYCWRISSEIFWPFLALFLFALCLFAFYNKFKYSQTFLIPDFLKPKTRAWYKRILP